MTPDQIKAALAHRNEVIEAAARDIVLHGFRPTNFIRGQNPCPACADAFDRGDQIFVSYEHVWFPSTGWKCTICDADNPDFPAPPAQRAAPGELEPFLAEMIAQARATPLF